MMQAVATPELALGDLAIRPATVADLAGIHAIYSYSVLHETASWELAAPDEAEMARRMATIVEQGYPYFVATCSNAVIGYTYASSYRPRLGYRFTVEDSVYVARAWQGRGVGQRLLMGLIAACAERNFRQMIAVIGDSENTGSIRLHERCGFRRVGLLPAIGYKFGRWLDSVLMQRDLGDGADPAAS